MHSTHSPSTPDTPAGPVRAASGHPLMVILVLGFSSLCASLMQSLVIPIQSELPHLLNTSASNTSWVITATLLGGAVSMPLAGRLADLYGKKPVLVACAATLIGGSVLCAVSSSFAIVLVGRVLQGFAMGYIPVAISMIREVAPARMVNSAMAAVSATLGVGGALGLPLAAWIVTDHDWHALFWLSTVLAALMTLATVFLLPSPKDAAGGRLDIVGAIGLAIGLVCVLVAITKGASWGWGSPATLGLLLGGLVVLLAWGWFELRHDEPLVDLRTTARRPVLLTNLAALMIGFGMMAQSIVMPQLLELPKATGFGLGQSILNAGLLMAPGGLMMLLFSPISSALLSKLGGRLTLVIGAVVLGGGYLAATFLLGTPWTLVLASCIACAGVGIGYAAMPSLIMANVPDHEAASSVGVNSLMRSMGTTIASAVMASVLTSNTVAFAGTQVPSEQAFKLCFVIGAAAALVSAAIAFAVPDRRGRRPEAVEELEADPVGAQPATA